jgi:hypothetical protein
MALEKRRFCINLVVVWQQISATTISLIIADQGAG